MSAVTLKPCAPAGCLVCRYPVATAHAKWGPIHASCLVTHGDVVEWLSALVAGPLGGCVACGGSSMWHHPTQGPLHPACARRAMRLLEDGGTDPVVVPVGGPKRGAYARRAMIG